MLLKQLLIFKQLKQLKFKNKKKHKQLVGHKSLNEFNAS